MKWIILCCVLIMKISFCNAIQGQDYKQVVKTQSGKIRGYWRMMYAVWKFLGIPYGAPPINKNRFKAPLPPPSWNDTLDAVDESRRCIQQTGRTRYDSEDCLYLNIYVPVVFWGHLKDASVVVYIHGGDFMYGAGGGLNPYHITKHTVILVTFNYRLGPLGFLCLGTDKIPGNAGLKDQIAVLRWINKNIENFGGNRKSVTVYGLGSGAVCAEYLVLSRLTKNLIHRAILESGSSLTPKGVSYNRLGVAKDMALRLGFMPVDDLDALSEFFMSIPTKRLYKFYTESFPCIEGNIIKETPEDILEQGKFKRVPVLLTFGNMEGLSKGRNFFCEISELQNHFEKYLPYDLYFLNDMDRDAKAREFKESYFGLGPITEASVRQYINFHTDMVYGTGTYTSAVYHSRQANPVYLMEFSYRGGFNNPIKTLPQFDGAMYSDVTAYVLDLNNYDKNTFDMDVMIRDRMTLLFGNFIKFGNPTPSATKLVPELWPTFSSDQQTYLAMGKNIVIGMIPEDLYSRGQIWQDVYESHRLKAPIFGKQKKTNIAPGSDLIQSLMCNFILQLCHFYIC